MGMEFAGFSSPDAGLRIGSLVTRLFLSFENMACAGVERAVSVYGWTEREYTKTQGVMMTTANTR